MLIPGYFALLITASIGILVHFRNISGLVKLLGPNPGKNSERIFPDFHGPCGFIPGNRLRRGSLTGSWKI